MEEDKETQATLVPNNSEVCNATEEVDKESACDHANPEKNAELNSREQRFNCDNEPCEVVTNTQGSSNDPLDKPIVSDNLLATSVVFDDKSIRPTAPSDQLVEPTVSNLQIEDQCSMAQKNSCQGSITHICLNCWEQMCSKCGEQHTKFGKITVDHEVKFISKVSESDIENHNLQKRYTCAKHELKIEWYCVPCEQAMCSECFLDQHDKHKSVKLLTVDKKFSARISDRRKQLKDIETEHEKRQQKMNQLKIRLGENYNRVQTELNDTTEHFKQQLQISYEQLMTEIENEKESSSVLLKNQFAEDIMQLENIIVKMQEKSKQLKETIELCDVHLVSNKTALDRADFIKSFDKQISTLDLVETYNPNDAPIKITEWKSFLLNWLQPAIEQLQKTSKKSTTTSEISIQGKTTKCNHEDRANQEKNKAVHNEEASCATFVSNERSDNSEEINGKGAMASEVTEKSEIKNTCASSCHEINDNFKLHMTPMTWQFLDRFYSVKLKDICGSNKLKIDPNFLNKDQVMFQRSDDDYKFEAETKQALENLPKKLGVKTRHVSLSEFGTIKEMALIKHSIMLDHQVILSENIDNRSWYLTGCIEELKIANDKLDLFNFSYANYKRKEAIYDEEIVNVYSTTISNLPLVISEPGRIFWQVYSSDENYANIIVKKGNLLTEYVEVIVNASHPEMVYKGGITKIIRQAAGEKIEEEGNLWLRKNGGKIRLTENAVTSAGFLPFKHIIHAVGPNKTQFRNEKECTEMLKNTFSNCFARADELCVTSVAMPAISSGNSGLSMETVIHSFCQATVTYFSERNRTMANLKLVKLVLIDELTLNEVRQYYASLADYAPFSNTAASTNKSSVPVTAASFDYSNNKADSASASSFNAVSTDYSKKSHRCCNCFTEVSAMKMNHICGHLWCLACLEKRKQESCNKCISVHNKWIKKQPPGTMKIINFKSGDLPDYKDCGKIEIQQHIPSGDFKLQPTSNICWKYNELKFTHYVPNNQEGIQLLLLFREAFDAGLLFSIAPGQRDYNVVWNINDFNYCTSKKAGSYKYPNKEHMKKIRDGFAKMAIY